MPSTTDNTTTTLSKFWTIYEVLVVLFFLPTAFGINKIIYIMMPSDPPFWVLPTILGFIISLALLISTPKHPYTPVIFALELTGITETTLIYNSGTASTVVAILCGPFWFFMIFLVLSVKGVEWDGMGHIGTTAKKITGVVKGIGLLAVTNLDMLRSLVVTNLDMLQSLVVTNLDILQSLIVTNLNMLQSLVITNFDTLQSLERELWGIEETSGDIEEAASNPGSQAILPSYVSIFPDSHIFSKAVT